MQVLQKENLNHVLCIVVRYFGKILLGAGGLVRAYSKSVTLCLKDHIIFLKKGYNIDIYFEYNNLKKIDYLLKDIIINRKKFESIVNYNLNVTDELYDVLKNTDLCRIEINKDIYL